MTQITISSNHAHIFQIDYLSCDEIVNYVLECQSENVMSIKSLPLNWVALAHYQRLCLSLWASLWRVDQLFRTGSHRSALCVVHMFGHNPNCVDHFVTGYRADRQTFYFCISILPFSKFLNLSTRSQKKISRISDVCAPYSLLVESPKFNKIYWWLFTV